MNIANSNRLFDSQKCKLGLPADSFIYNDNVRPTSDFVLCRDINNEPTAVFGEDIWDFNPYRLSAMKINKLRFDSLLSGEHKSHRRKLVDEAKHLLFLIQYFAKAGHTGTISVSTLYGYYQVMANAVEYCISLHSNQFVGIIELSELFANERFLNNFLKTKSGTSFQKRTRAICKHLAFIGHIKVGFLAVPNLKINVSDSEQTPVIPTNIYLTLINHLTETIEYLNENLTSLPDFLEEFIDPYFGRSQEFQKSKGVGGEKFWRKTMKQAIEEYDLGEIFSDDLAVSDIRSLSGALRSIQYQMRLAIHLYTGMRDQEVMRLPFDCIEQKVITEKQVDKDGKEVVEKRVIKLISTTTKYTGYRESAAWYAAPETEKAINVLQLVCAGLARIYRLDVKDCDLFINPSVVKNPELKVSVTNFASLRRKPSWLDSLLISKEDYAELQKSDPERDFCNSAEFGVGKVWPIKSHQFRRSLAFYASSSGFVKLPTLKRQFKHLTKDITRYYSRNFENAQSIFGRYNKETKSFDLTSEHIIFDCQNGEVTNVVDMLVNDLLNSSEKLYGKTGGYVERQRENLRNEEVLVLDVRVDTTKRVEKGELYYRETLLGGCMSIEKCDSFMLGAITECLTCDDSAIKEDKVNIQIQKIEEQLTAYEATDGEYQVLLAELEKLISYKEHRMIGEQDR
ncbi:integrase [Pseudoalteromonas sp. NCCP-2140]|uniref:hypothetical protein n=1 Tax=Pseudoalteromonas sp. NCCP-2140 TaxID=2942288 RepID=UPI00203D2FFD|nr:hypothetical protein [Pseudoalteromonas sp. NCCP-2140]GKW51772.1 integrase [Pseudoalteromonas sp. NCCP-2140]